MLSNPLKTFFAISEPQIPTMESADIVMECDIQGSRKMPKRKSSFSCLDDDDMGDAAKAHIMIIGRCKGGDFGGVR